MRIIADIYVDFLLNKISDNALRATRYNTDGHS